MGTAANPRDNVNGMGEVGKIAFTATLITVNMVWKLFDSIFYLGESCF
jgi:hypothetical protein